MRSIVTLLVFLFCIFFKSSFLLAQKAEVLGAYKYLQVYQSNDKCVELDKAKTAIDLAINDIQTAQWAKTWKYRGDIYYEIALSDKKECSILADSSLSISYRAYQKAIELDVKKFYPTEIQTRLAVLGPYFLRQGVNEYNQEEYLNALRSFQNSIEIARYFNKTDSLGIYNAALSAEQLKKYGLSQSYYTELIKVKYGGPKIYSFLANSYLKVGDSTQVLTAILAGRSAYPKDTELIKEELNFYLDLKKYESAAKTLTEVIEMEPNNHVYLYYKGTVHDNLKEFEEAEAAYRRCLSLKPDYFEANYNLGALFYNMGLDLTDEAYRDGVDQQKLDEAKAIYLKAIPYLKEAHDLDNYDQSTLISLQKIYSILSMDKEYEEVTNELEN